MSLSVDPGLYQKPERWSEAKNKLFPMQVGFTSPPHDFDAAPSDFLRIAPETIGAHGRMLHVPGYAHELDQRAKNFHLLEDFVQCMANNGADVCGQVGTNWVHCNGTSPDEIRTYCENISDKYETPFHMAGYCLIEALQALDINRVALNSVYYWPDWRDGIAGFLRAAGIELVYCGNFVDLGLYDTQEEVNEQTWIFPGDMARESVRRTLEQAGDVDALLVNGMPNFRRADGLPQRMVSLTSSLESEFNLPIVSSDTALYWRIFKTLGASPKGSHGRLLTSLKESSDA